MKTYTYLATIEVASRKWGFLQFIKRTTFSPSKIKAENVEDFYSRLHIVLGLGKHPERSLVGLWYEVE